MVVRLDIAAPATITALAGDGAVDSLGQVPPALVVTDPDGAGTITVKLIAHNASTTLSAAGSGGAIISADGNTLSITGDMAQVNAALATLDIAEAATSTSDMILITASDPAELPARTDIHVVVASDAGPAFAAPPGSVTLKPNALDPLTGLAIGDPQLAALGPGIAAQETCALTLAAASGLLFLPGFSTTDGISATGLGTGTIVLEFLSGRLAAVNALLAGLEFAGPTALSGLAYALDYLGGPLPATATSGNIVLDITGTAGATGSFAAGDQAAILGETSYAAGATLTVTTATGDLGGIEGAGAVLVAPGAALNLPYNNMSLGGTSLDLGTLSAVDLAESGTLIIADSASFAGAATLGTAAVVDFAGTFVAGGANQEVNELAVSLQEGALLTGGGILAAGNFSEAGLIQGPGTIAVQGGETLVIAAASIGGGAALEVAPGGVMVLGPVSPLYGVFDPTPLTIDSSVTLAFTGTMGITPIEGGYADALDQTGGVFVINGPQVFAGTITGFEPGDRLIFPGLSEISLLNITSESFDIAGQNSSGVTVEYQINADTPAGDALYFSQDDEGDTEVGLRLATPQVDLGGTTIALANIEATANVPQPLQGFALLLSASTSFSLTVTLSVEEGVLTDGTLPPGATLTLTAPNVTALNEDLAGLVYTGNGAVDTLTISSATGVLAGLAATAHISPVSAGAASGSGSAAQTASFTAPVPGPFTAAAAWGELYIAATNDFADALILNGVSGTALLVDHKAAAVFDTGANVRTEADVTIGDAGGAGTLAVITDNFTVGANSASANVTIGGLAAAAGSGAEIFGTLGISGDLVIGTGATASLALAGNLGAAATELGVDGALTAFGTAVAALGTVQDDGIADFTGNVAVSASALALAGHFTLGGDATFTDTGNLGITAGTLLIGPDAALSAAALAMTGGTLADRGTLSLALFDPTGGLVSLAGGTIIAAGLTVGAGATLAGNGVLAPAGEIANAGTIEATGGDLLLGTDVANTGLVEIAGAATLDAARALDGALVFTGTHAELIVNDVALFSASVAGLATHDVIDLVGVAPSLVSDAGGSITVGTGSAALGGFDLATVAGAPAVKIVSDGDGGALITVGGEMPCFARGTRLLTPNGYRPVETLRPADGLVTTAGDRRPIRWIGRRTLDFSEGAVRAAWPVLIMPGAFGKNLPLRPLRLSPLHAVFIDGALVPATHLVNGATILREQGPAVTYYHVELDRHDVVFAEGLPCETYLDTGNRGALYEEAGRRTPARTPCAPRITGGAKLAMIRRRLHGIALAAGFSLTYQPFLRVVAEDRTILPDIIRRGRRRLARLPLPPGATRLTLLSRCAAPADTDPDSDDRRDLALCLESAVAGKVTPRLGEGWLPRAAADDGNWMGPRAQILLPRPADHVTLSLAAVIRTWRPPGSLPELRQ
jgi:hypothetical protein